MRAPIVLAFISAFFVIALPLGLSQPVTFSPTAVEFGSVEVSSAATVTVDLFGAEPLQVTSLFLVNDYGEMGVVHTVSRLGDGADPQSVEVQWTPQGLGDINTLLRVNYVLDANASSNFVMAAVTGSAVPPTPLEFTVASVDFGSINVHSGDSVEVAVMVSNVGTTQATITGVTMDDGAGITLTAPDAIELPPGAHATFTAIADPAGLDAGTYDDSIIVEHQYDGATNTISLDTQFVGYEYAIALSPSEAEFGSFVADTVTEDIVTINITLSNNGATNMTVPADNFNAGGSPFTVCDDQLPLVLEPSGSALCTVTFNTSADVKEYSTTVTASAVEAAGDLKSDPITINMRAILLDFTAPTSLDMGFVDDGDMPYQDDITIDNFGPQLAITNILPSPQSSPFTYNGGVAPGTNDTIDKNAAQTYSIDFDSPTKGVYTADIVVHLSDQYGRTSHTHTIPVSVEYGDVTVSSEVIDFGSVSATYGETVSSSVTFTSEWTSTSTSMYIDDVSNNVFSTGSVSTLAPGGNATLELFCTPAVDGVVSGIVTVDLVTGVVHPKRGGDNTGLEAGFAPLAQSAFRAYELIVNATATTNSPLQLSFGNASLEFEASASSGNASVLLSVLNDDAYGKPITLVSLTITGDNATDFGVDDSLAGTTIDSGSSSDVNVTFVPSVEHLAEANATLTIVYRLATGTTPYSQDVPLYGLSVTFVELEFDSTLDTSVAVDFGQYVPGASWPSVTFNVTNPFGTELTFDAWPPSDGVEHHVTVDGVDTAIAADGTRTVTVTYSPDADTAGTTLETVRLEARSADNTSAAFIEFNATGEVLVLSATLNETSFSFGEAAITERQYVSFELVNNGTVALRASQVVFDPDDGLFALDTALPVAIDPSASATLRFVVDPIATQASASTSVTLDLWDPNEDGSTSVELTLNASTEATVPTLSAIAEVYFGSRRSDEEPLVHTIEFTNTGDVPVDIANVTVTNATFFSVESIIATSLAPSETLSVDVTFNSTSGNESTSVTVEFESQWASLTGEVSVAVSAATYEVREFTLTHNSNDPFAGSYDFGEQFIGAPSQTKKIYFRNPYLFSLTMDDWTGPDDTFVTEFDEIPFKLEAGEELITPNTVIGSYSVLILVVTFNPSQTSNTTVSLLLTGDSDFSIAESTIELSGTGKLVLASLGATVSSVATDSGSGASVPVELHNDGDGPITITNITINDTHESATFALEDSVPSALDQGAMQNVSISFDSNIVGEYEATLNIEWVSDWNASSSGTTSLTISARRVHIAEFDVPAVIDLGDVAIGATSTTSLTVENPIAFYSLSFAAWTDDNGVYSVAGLDQELALFGQVTIDISCSPTEEGEVNATVELRATDTSEGYIASSDIELTCVGMVPTLSVHVDAALPFDALESDNDTLVHLLDLENEVEVPIVVSAAVFTGDSHVFATNITLPQRVDAWAHLEIPVLFGPSGSLASFQAELHIEYHAEVGPPQTTNVSVLVYGARTSSLAFEVPDSLTFDPHFIGAPASVQSIEVVNPHNTTLEFEPWEEAVPKEERSFEVSGLDQTLEPLASVTVNVSFSPHGLTNSAEFALRALSDDELRVASATISLSGDGMGVSVDLSASTLDFGRVVDYATHEKVLELQTTAEYLSFQITNVSFSGADADAFSWTGSVPSGFSGESLLVSGSVRFEPVDPSTPFGFLNSTVCFTVADESGNAVDSDLCVLLEVLHSPASAVPTKELVDVGVVDIDGSYRLRSVNFRNPSAVTIEIESTELVDCDSSWSMDGDIVGSTVNAGKLSSAFRVKFDPMVLGNTSCDAKFVFSNTELAGDEFEVTVPFVAQVLYAARLGDVLIEGPSCGECSPTWYVDAAVGFAWEVSNPYTDKDLSLSVSWSGYPDLQVQLSSDTLASNGSVLCNVTFVPTLTSTLESPRTSTDVELTVQVVGVAENTESTASLIVVPSSIAVPPLSTLELDNLWDGFDFGLLYEGDTHVRTVELKNFGDYALNITGVQTGESFFDAAVGSLESPASFPLSVGSLEVVPLQLAFNTSGSVKVSSTTASGNYYELEIAFDFTSTTVKIAADKTTLDFGRFLLEAGVEPINVTLTNAGTTNATNLVFAIDSDAFTVHDAPESIAAGEAVTVSVSFDANGTAGAYSAEIVISGSAINDIAIPAVADVRTEHDDPMYLTIELPNDSSVLGNLSLDLGVFFFNQEPLRRELVMFTTPFDVAATTVFSWEHGQGFAFEIDEESADGESLAMAPSVALAAEIVLDGPVGVFEDVLQIESVVDNPLARAVGFLHVAGELREFTATAGPSHGVSFSHSIGFGGATVDRQTLSKDLTITNDQTGGAAIVVVSIAVVNGGTTGADQFQPLGEAVDTLVGQTVLYGESVTGESLLQFTPVRLGDTRAILYITLRNEDDSVRTTLGFGLRGEGVDAPPATVSFEGGADEVVHLEAEPSANESETVSVLVGEVGGTLELTLHGDEHNQFQVSPSSVTADANVSLAFTVTFWPNSSVSELDFDGVELRAVLATEDGREASASLDLTARRLQGLLRDAVGLSTVQFGTVDIATGSPETRSITIENIGNLPLTIDRITLEPESDAFEVDSSPLEGATLAAQANVSVNVTFMPTAVDTVVTFVRVQYAYGENGTEATTDVAKIRGVGSAAEPIITGDVASVSFGDNVLVGDVVSRTLMFTVDGGGQVGNVSLRLDSHTPTISFSPESFENVSVGTLEVVVSFRPVAPGTVNDEVTAEFVTVGGEKRAYVDLEGTAEYGTGLVEVSPQLLEFDAAPVQSVAGTTARQQLGVQLTNSGLGNATLTLEVSGNSFVVVDEEQASLPLAQGARRTVLVEFSPEAVGQVNATLVVNASSGVTEVALSGFGMAPSLRVEPSTVVDFGQVNVDSSKARAFRCYNDGDYELVLQDADATGAFSVLSSVADALVQPGDSAVLRVLFEPSAAQEYTGALTVSSSDPEQPSVARSLSGRGYEPQANLRLVGVQPQALSVELRNFGDGTADSLEDVQVCADVDEDCVSLASVGSLEPGASVELSVSLSRESGSVALRRNDLLDYVRYGSGANQSDTDAAAAVEAGFWDEGAFVVGAGDMVFAGDGTETGSRHELWVSNACEPNPCENGGQCSTNTSDAAVCACGFAFRGSRCEEARPTSRAVARFKLNVDFPALEEQQLELCVKILDELSALLGVSRSRLSCEVSPGSVNVEVEIEPASADASASEEADGDEAVAQLGALVEDTTSALYAQETLSSTDRDAGVETSSTTVLYCSGEYAESCDASTSESGSSSSASTASVVIVCVAVGVLAAVGAVAWCRHKGKVQHGKTVSRVGASHTEDALNEYQPGGAGGDGHLGVPGQPAKARHSSSIEVEMVDRGTQREGEV